MNRQILKINLNKEFPIPGTSLTADPDNPLPHERPPEFTNLHKALDSIFQNAIEPENYVELINLLGQGFPLMEIVQTTVFTGFYEGKWNHSLMLLLVEPVAYIFLALAERADIDPVFFRDEARDDLEDEETFGLSFEATKLEQMQSDIEQNKKPHPAVTDEMLKRIEEIPATESLLSPPQMEEEGPSLMVEEQQQ